MHEKTPTAPACCTARALARVLRELRWYSPFVALAFPGLFSQTANGGNGGATVTAMAWQRPGSRDAAVVVTLKSGRYRAHVRGNAGTGGVVLLEVYEVR